ncbi:MAG: hypothetical protein EHM19_03660 [Candidatus Latescibacterota bacterium]|nr:MAG: hypothetical protein EHM19_03660 [Candidatus Latescibacterota bacterium]
MMRLCMLGFLFAALLAGCGGSGGDGEPVATIGKHTITMTDLDRRLAEMPPGAMPQFEGEEGRRRLLEGVIDEEAFLLAAGDMKLDENPEVRRQIDYAVRRVLIQAYYQREVAPYTQMTQEDMLVWYEEHPDEFTRPEESEVRQIVVGTEQGALDMRRRLLAGEPWEPLVEKYCIDEPTKKRSGLIGPVPKNASIIPLVGSSAELARMIDTITVGKISPPVRTGKGFHVLTVERRNPSALVPFEKVVDMIRRNHSATFAEKIRKEKVGALREKYGVKILREPTAAPDEKPVAEGERPAAKLFELAQSTADPQARLKYYDEIVRNHPDDPVACEAQFMIGFVYSEELHDFDKARTALEKVVNDDKRCGEEMRKNARWLIENMGSEPPEFQD